MNYSSANLSHLRSLGRGIRPTLALVLLLAATVASVQAASVREAERLFRTGQYEKCVAIAKAEIDRGVRLEDWHHLKANAEFTLGKYPQALATVEQGLEEYTLSIRMRLLAEKIYRYNGRSSIAETQLNLVDQLVRRRPRRYSSAKDRLALGDYLLSRGADARQVLELCYDPVVEEQPEFVEAHLATAQLALDKYDFGLAANTLAAVPDSAQEYPQYHYLLARAFGEDDPQRAGEALEEALELNPRHLDSLLLKVEKLIDGEQYDEASQLLEELRETNAQHPIAWAYEAVLANLDGDAERESSFREAALAFWESNPEVDYTIGRKLSEKYRFAEGAAYQRGALAMEPDYLPAQIQLAQDLLRLGEEEEGWQLIHQISANDGYNVVAHNLANLHDSLKEYRVLANDSFRVRMEASEADIYGPRVLDLLAEAKRVLCEKYDVAIDEPVIVDIFPSKNDFAVRTFGIPGADGFLGVCFGNVITANSPAALGNQTANWQAVLWHEFCHIVTLQKSKNKMPRWLSEGISVYEELERNGAWGQKMTPAYRKLILDGEMAPLSELSSMFLAPKSGMHLQFAYYESAMAVDYIIEQYGIDAVKEMLADLAEGVSINETLIRRVAPLGDLDTNFEKHMIRKAKRLAAELTWEEPELPPTADAAMIAEWVEDHPNNFHGLMRLGQQLLEEQAWQEALEPAEWLRKQFPEYTGPANGYVLSARAYRELEDFQTERKVLEAWCERDGEAVDAYFRLMELGEVQEDWQLVMQNAKRLLAVNPLSPAPHRYLARAAEVLDDAKSAITAYEALLHFDTADLVDAHFRLGTLLYEQGEHSAARRRVLRALEDAPRFLAAHRLLLQLVEQSGPPPAGSLARENDSEEPSPTEVVEDANPSAEEEP